MSSLPSDSDTPGPVGADMYDDPADGVNLARLNEWIVATRAGDWAVSVTDQGLIRDVLAALQAVGDATLVKNGTYRAMRKDGAAIERLNAWLQNHGEAAAIVEHDGDAVAAAIELLARGTRT